MTIFLFKGITSADAKLLIKFLAMRALKMTELSTNRSLLIKKSKFKKLRCGDQKLFHISHSSKRNATFIKLDRLKKNSQIFAVVNISLSGLQNIVISTTFPNFHQLLNETLFCLLATK